MQRPTQTYDQVVYVYLNHVSNYMQRPIGPREAAFVRPVTIRIPVMPGFHVNGGVGALHL